jgi:dienelactone hydrolase
MKRLAAGVAIAALLGACGGSDDDIGPTNPTSGNGVPVNSAPSSTGFTALFVPLSGVLPYPNDAYFAGSTDGTLNMPASSFAPVTFTMPGSNVPEPVVNALDGFSTTDAISARFDGNINASSLTFSSVVVLQVDTDLATKGVKGVVRPLTPGTDYTVGVDPASSTTLQILPVKPLLAKSSYLVILTNGIKDASGKAASADVDFAAISSAIITEFNSRPPNAPPAPASCTTFTNATLKGLCQLTSTHFLVARGAGINLSNIVLTFSFSTQSISDTLVALNSRATAGAYTIANTGLTTAQAVPGSPGLASIYAGTLRVPYYLTAPSASNPTAPLNRYWLTDTTQPNPPGIDPNSRLVTRFKPLPEVTATLDIPLLLTIPTSGGPGPNGWPIVIFQHGTPRTRGDALLVADSFAAAGFATIAIDLPLHGITPADSFAALRQAGRERTFDLDLVNNSTLAPGPDGNIDDTGTHFINLANLLVARDNVRQATSDQIVLVKTIPTIDFDGNSSPDFDPARIHFVGYSLGAISALPLLGVNSDIQSASLPMGAGRLPYILRESDFYKPRINAALAAANAALVPGSPLYNTFFRDAQTAIDSADSANYAAAAVTLPAGNPRKIHMMYIVGGAANPAGGNWAPDGTVPFNRSQQLADLLNLPVFTTSGAVTGNGGQVKLNSGVHGSYLDPRPAAAVTAEMQQQIATFIATNGAAINIANPAVVAQ